MRFSIRLWFLFRSSCYSGWTRRFMLRAIQQAAPLMAMMAESVKVQFSNAMHGWKDQRCVFCMGVEQGKFLKQNSLI